MALQAELLSLLDNSDEPLSKRLRIATDVFNTNELPAFNKESVLLNWLGKICSKTDTNDAWHTLHELITSPHVKDIPSNEIKHNVLSTIVKATIKQLRKDLDGDTKSNVVKCGIALLNIEIFQQYFKHDLKHYCGLVSEILLNSEDVNLAREIIFINLLFNEKHFDKTEYTTNFLSSTFDALLKVLIKFQDNNLYKDAVQLIHRAVFKLHSNDFTNFLTKLFEVTELPDESSNIILNKLNALYNSDSESCKLGFKIIFITSLSVCNTEILRYKFFVLILHVIGFKVKKLVKLNLLQNDGNFELEKSLEILAEIMEILHTRNIVIKETINEINFSDFLKSLVISVIRLQTQPTINTLKILKYMIDIDPKIIENSIDEIFALIILFKKDENLQIIYTELMIFIMKMYFKMHRIGKFYSMLLDTTEKKLNFNFKSSKPEIKFSGEIKNYSATDLVCVVKDVFPDKVLQYFQECLTLQSASVGINIIRNFLYHLKQITDNFQSYATDQKVLFVQLISELICNLLSAVKLIDNTASEESLNRFVKEMNSLREGLKTFGTVLLTVEHNQLLMFSFLNICYTWAEVAMLISFYTSAKDLTFKGEIENDKSVNNLTYLHNYLSAEQWSLVTQRIKNFGEQPCKHILQKLLIQKLRAMFIFESEVNEVIESSIVSSYATNLETSWHLILSERFIASTFVPKMESSQLIIMADLLVNHLVDKNNFEVLKHRSLIDSRDLMTSVFYVCLSKISDLFKRKRKHGDATVINPICIKIFKSIDKNSFIKTEVVDLEKIAELFDTSSDIHDLKINEKNFCTFMEIIKYVPVTSLSHDVQVTLFLFLLSICSDLKKSRAHNVNCLQKCEEYLIALVENYLTSPNIFSYMKSDILIKYIVENIDKYKNLLTIIIGKGLTQNDTIPLCKSAINLLEKHVLDEKYLEIIFITLHGINNSSLKNVTEENKAILQKYKDKLFKKFLNRIIVDEAVTDSKIIVYRLLLENYLANNTDDTLAKLISMLKQYSDYAVNNINENNTEEILGLFKLIFLKKSEITNVPEDFIMSALKVCNELKNIEKYDNFNQITPLLFQDVSAENFSAILKDLLKTHILYIKSNDSDNIINKLIIWKIAINSNLSNQKNQIITNMIQIVFSNLVVFLSNNNTQEFTEKFVNIQLNIIENRKMQLSPIILDALFQTTQILISKEQTIVQFITAFDSGFSILESLVKTRKELLIDRLPTFLLHFRLYLHHLCLKSNSEVEINHNELIKITDCAFKIEKLTRNICAMKADFERITPYLIADFLKEFEKIALYPDVKHHLNNCLMELIELCDKYAVSYLLRVLSPASTELFKEVHNNYKKYYRFTGKV